MADKNDARDNAEQTLLTLEQLSQTLDVMTCVVDRLKQHLERQMSLTKELFNDEEQLRQATADEQQKQSRNLKDSSTTVELNQREIELLEAEMDDKVH